MKRYKKGKKTKESNVLDILNYLNMNVLLEKTNYCAWTVQRPGDSCHDRSLEIDDGVLPPFK